MKLHYLLIVFLVQVSYSQISDIEQADTFSSKENYSDEIKLRKSILKKIVDRNSEAFKTQDYKVQLAEYHVSDDVEGKLLKISKAEEIFNTLKEQNPIDKIKISIEHVASLIILQKFEEAKIKINAIHQFSKQQPKTREFNELRISILLYSSNVELELADYDKSLENLNDALKMSIELYGENSLETAGVYKDLGRVYSFTDNFQESLSNGEKALGIYEKIQPKDKYILFKQYATVYERYKYYGEAEKIKALFKQINEYYDANKHRSDFININNDDYPNLNAVKTTYLYIQLQHAASFQDREKVREAFDEFIESMPSGPVLYNNLELNSIVSFHFEAGYFFHRLADYADIQNYHIAKKYYHKALEFTQDVGFEFGELQAYWILSTLGVDYKQWNDVIPITEKAFKKPSIEKFNQLKYLKHNLALAYGSMRKYDQAMELLDEEYRGILEGNATDYYAIDNLMESGKLYLDMYEDNPQSEFLEKAYNNFHLCSVVFSRLYRGGEFSPRLTWYKNRINDGMLRTASMMGENQKAVAERVEINNSDFLWSSFVKNRKEPFSEASLLLQNDLDSLEFRQSLLASKIHNASLGVKEIEGLRADLKSTEKRYNKTSQELKTADNIFYQFSRSDFDLDKLREGIGKNEVLVKYIITDLSAFAFTINQKSVNLFQLKITGPELKAKVVAYLDVLKTADPEFVSKSEVLYSDLITPLSLHKNAKLVFIPDGFLSNLPFETLLTAEGKYLLEDHSVSYAYSLMLFDIQKSVQERSKGLVAAFSPQYNLQYAMNSDKEDLQILVRSGNYELLGAQAEARYVNSVFGGDLFLGELATKSNFLEKSPNYDILHLAMHAVVNEEDSNKSSLIFNNDERLYLSELYDIKIPAHLVVLSACDTGSGELKEGEGVQSLSRAFTYAGVRSTVMSLWPVPDRETSIIMTEFYNHLKDGKPKDEALQLAKVNYLKNVKEVELKHPYYWAGFIVSGDVTPLQTGFSFWWYVGIAVLVLLIFMWYLKRKRYL